VEAIARYVGLRVVPAPLGGDISGLLVTRKGSSTICVEERHHENRQRFTIAHEIGHHVLGHHFGEGENVHVDRVSMRSAKSSEGSDRLEIAANQFAAALLMPERVVELELQRLQDSPGEDVVRELARRFKVSTEAMAIRLSVLGYDRRTALSAVLTSKARTHPRPAAGTR
jgi:Zn-dependent peptidase ImmA (M78 family)